LEISCQKFSQLDSFEIDIEPLFDALFQWFKKEDKPSWSEEEEANDDQDEEKTDAFALSNERVFTHVFPLQIALQVG
jgi:hypothetical protein